LILLLVVGIVLVSGCFKIQIREQVGSNGMSDLTIVLEALNASAVGWDKNNPCDEFEANETVFMNARCSFDGKRETVTGKFNRKNAGGLTVSGTRYRLDVVDAIQGFDAGGEKKPAAPRNKTELRKLKAAGVAEDYYVKLPGRVTKQVGGTLQPDGWVKFDLLDPELPDKPYVESDGSLLGLLLTGDEGSGKTGKQSGGSGSSGAGENKGGSGSKEGGSDISKILDSAGVDVSAIPCLGSLPLLAYSLFAALAACLASAKLA